ncbi:uncharacterized protein LOC135462103 [Liolophura sinensis]|uniref:uncharacterized protein LOC135462103 n=1 Tax=Liolophura sinensis TaxID=3198878 RepID=UPI0031596A98
MRPSSLITVLVTLASLYIFTVQALPQWRPQGRFGKRLDPELDVLAQLHSDDENTSGDTERTRDLLQNLLDGFPSSLCFRLTGGKLRCLRQRRARSASTSRILTPGSTVM